MDILASPQFEAACIDGIQEGDGGRGENHCESCIIFIGLLITHVSFSDDAYICTCDISLWSSNPHRRYSICDMNKKNQDSFVPLN